MTELLDQFEDVVALSAEEWGKMYVERVEIASEIFSPGLQFYFASVRFEGAARGAFTVLCQSGFAESLARSLNDEIGVLVEEDDKYSVLRTFAEVISKNLVNGSPQVHGKLKMLPPEITIGDEEEVRQLMSEVYYSFLANDEPFGVMIALERG